MTRTLLRLAGLSSVAMLSLFVLSACGADAPALQEQSPSPIVTSQDLSSDEIPGTGLSEAILPETGWGLDMPRLDEQGEVGVEITPLNLNMPGETLDFSVVMNTHSVDLSMDLVGLASLTTDTGHEIQAEAWEAPSGGHHVQGILKFPAIQDGAGVMDGVQRLTLVIRGLDAPERSFVWER